jgi:hypothetical protein
MDVSRRIQEEAAMYRANIDEEIKSPFTRRKTIAANEKVAQDFERHGQRKEERGDSSSRSTHTHSSSSKPEAKPIIMSSSAASNSNSKATSKAGAATQSTLECNYKKNCLPFFAAIASSRPLVITTIRLRRNVARG